MSSAFYFTSGVMLVLFGIFGIIVCFKAKVSKKIPLGMIVLGFVLIFVAGSKVPEEQQAAQQKAIQEQQQQAEKQALLKQIELEADVQDMVDSQGRRKVVIWVKNNSPKTFSGSVEVKSVDVSGSTLGWDIVYPKDVEPGKSTYAILWLKTWPGGSIKGSISSAEFK